MKDKSSDSVDPGKLGVLAATGVTTLWTSYVLGGGNHDPTIAAGLIGIFFTMFPPALGLVVQSHFEAQRARADAWWRAFVAASGRSDEGAQRLLNERAGDKRFAAAVTNGIRAMLDAADDSTVPALGRLAFRYSDKKPDALFRGLARTLSDMSAEDFEAFGAYLRAARSGFFADREEIKFGWHWSDPTPTAYVEPEAREHPDFSADAKEWDRVFDLLLGNHLAQTNAHTENEAVHEIFLQRTDVIAMCVVVLGDDLDGRAEASERGGP